ncbi:hypothetical protein BC332_00145 [Capsicum chinense]|nr:hypothetical protein BC332_00145 [Capsicum chinense]
MDNPPSFSLGITQLDATVQDIPLKFVPATFDEQDPDWAEIRSKHRNDPVTMNKLTDKTASKLKKSTSKASKKKFDDSGRPRLPKIGQISKCLLMLEIQQDNKDEPHVWVQGEILKFIMLEFVIISGLKCTNNINDYMYTSSSKSALMSRYFPDNKGSITRSKLITRVQNGNFDNAEDALNLAILFFVHTFMFSQHKEAPISVVHFQIIEDGRYIHFPWGKVAFEKLMSSWQQDFNIVKQLYSLGGMPHVLNVWMFECCSENIQPTTDEVRRLNLSFSKDFEICDPTTYASTSDSGKLKRKAVEIQQRVGTIAEEFGDFSTIPPWEILIKTGFESPVSPDQPLKKRKTVIFEQKKQAVMDDDTSGSGHAVHHGSDLYCETHKDATDKGEIGVSKIQHHHHIEIEVSPQSHQYKFVPSSSTQPEGTSKSSLDGDEIKNYINKCFTETMAEVVTLISKIPAEVVKALKNGQNKQSQDEIMAYEEECSDEELKKNNISDVEALPVWELQASKEKAPTKRKRKKFNILRSPYISKYGSGSKDAGDIDKEEKLKFAFNGYNINQDLPNELMIDYSQWIAVGLLKTHSAKKETDNHYRVNASGLGFRQLDFVVAYAQLKN